jgi:hypothetical protein
MEIAIIILSILSLIQFIVGGFVISGQISTIKRLKVETGKLKAENDEYDRILPGERITFPMELTYSKEHSFKVLYEANVIEVSPDKVKVDPYKWTFTSNVPDKINSLDPSKFNTFEKNVLEYPKETWISRKDISIILGTDDIRNRKLEKLLED